MTQMNRMINNLQDKENDRSCGNAKSGEFLAAFGYKKFKSKDNPGR